MNIKAFLGFLAFAFIAVVVIVVAFNIGNSTDTTDIDDVDITALVNGESATSYAVRGRIVANEEHVGYKITVTATERRIDQYVGYDERIVNTLSYPNTLEAYEEFIFALDRYNLDSQDDTDLRGICATGLLYQYEITNTGERVANEWNTSCGGGSSRRFNASFLYEEQIPDFRDFTSSINL